MASNSRLATAIHTAGLLAVVGELQECVTSENIAKSVGTNSVVIRRLIGSLVKHGLVEVQMGAGGGSRLTRSADQITLADIYLALEEGTLFQVPILDEEHGCPFGKTVRPVLSEVLHEAESGLLERLGNITLADVIGKVKGKLSESDFCEMK